MGKYELAFTTCIWRGAVMYLACRETDANAGPTSSTKYVVRHAVPLVMSQP